MRRKMTANDITNFKRILTPPKQSFFLMGPRGSGKSTWLRSLYRDAHVVDLLSEEKYQRRLVVYPQGPVLRTQDGIDVLPFQEFCSLLASGEIWRA
jgi:ABC-type ATPase involved in cell division